MPRFLKYILFVLICTTWALAQTKPAKIWATATFNKSEVQLGEPLVVTVTVYTSTWFTDPPVFEEIQVKGSLMAKLEQRNSATSVTIGRKQYPAIKQRFVIYPNVIGTNTLPEFKVTTNCPPEGGYKGLKREVNSKEKTFTVLAPPQGIDPKLYLAAYNVQVKDQWNTNFKNLKAGDVLERRISISASGALAAAIPPLKLDSISFGSIYLKPPVLINRQNRNSFSGVRTEIINYLLEEDGDFTIPPVKLSWFNLKAKVMDSSSVEPIELSIAENPDLSFILSRQKELQQELAESELNDGANKAPFSLFGFPWWQFLMVLLVIVYAIRLIIKLVLKTNLRRNEIRTQHLESEAYYFKMLKASINSGTNEELIRNFYAWYDRYRGIKFGPQISEIIAQINKPELTEMVTKDLAQFYKNHQDVNRTSVKQFIQAIEQYKKEQHSKTHRSNYNGLTSINP